MFKNRYLQVRLAKDAESTPMDEEVRPVIDIEELSHHAKELTKHVAVAVIAVMGAAYAFSTAREVIVNNTNPSKKN